MCAQEFDRSSGKELGIYSCFLDVVFVSAWTELIYEGELHHCADSIRDEVVALARAPCRQVVFPTGWLCESLVFVLAAYILFFADFTAHL